jgi:hypothetical protein
MSQNPETSFGPIQPPDKQRVDSESRRARIRNYKEALGDIKYNLDKGNPANREFLLEQQASIMAQLDELEHGK